MQLFANVTEKPTFLIFGNVIIFYYREGRQREYIEILPPPSRTQQIVRKIAKKNIN